MTKERRFYDTLKNIFIGAPVEGESGYINLMRIKARYFEQVMMPHLQKEIDQAVRPFPDFREELFDKLYTFFKRYFTESGSIGFFFTPYHQSVYEQVYTDDRDVMLFWKTARLYYVKTDRLFRSMKVELDGFHFFFDVSTLEHKKANEKRELVFAFEGRQDDGTLVFTVTYSEKGRTTRLDEIRRAIRDALGLKKNTDAVPSEETLERAFRLFERQSEVDYFICKDAKSFLREQFDLWMCQYLLGKPGEEPETQWTEQRLKQLQSLKRIAYRVIDFVAAFEGELVKIWNKPKFALKSGYVITLDHIYDRNPELLEKIIAHPGFAPQVKEWQDLGMVDDGFTAGTLYQEDLTGKFLHPRYRFLPIDTRYFKELELQILSLSDNLDEALDGWLIKSENYQALKTILPKFREKVKCIYIDPPYNTGSDEFVYEDRIRHSSWLTMMENRLALAKVLMQPDGGLFVSIDYNEDTRLRLLLEGIFGSDQFRNTIAVSRVKKSIMERERVKSLNWGHGYLFFFAASDKTLIVPPMRPSNSTKQEKWHAFDAPGIRPTMEYTLFGQKPPPGRHWMYSEEKALQMIEQGNLRRNPKTGRIEYRVPQSERIILDTNWTDILESDSKWGFITEKSIVFLQRILGMLVVHEDFVMDFFAGSGTTAHAVINLNRQDGGKRKYILVEMADYFHTVLLPRIKKVVFSDKWRDGKAQPDGQGISHFVKYYELEQYEDTLRRARYLDDDLFTPPATEDPCQYLFLRDPKMLEALEVNLEEGTIKVDLSKLYPDIDLVETLSNLTGKWIRRIHPDPEETTKPGKVEFADGTTADLKNLDWRLIKPLIWW